jgi:hypothetical protein
MNERSANMDSFTTRDLEELMKDEGFPRVSIFMPTFRAGKEVQQNSIRFRNLLDKATEELAGSDLDSTSIERLLEPATDVVRNRDLWRRQSDGLAAFIGEGKFRVYRLPQRFDELVVVTDRFHVKPLVSFVAEDRVFYVLALSQKEVRLIECTRQDAVRVPLKGVPESILETTDIDRAEKTLQFHTRTTGRTGKRDAIFHGTGATVSPGTKKTILRYFRRVDRGVSRVLRKMDVPLVVAAVDYLIPIYKVANTHPYLAEQGIPGNPESAAMEELRDRALEILEPQLRHVRAASSKKYKKLIGSGFTSDDLKETLVAAHHSRVETLFVPVGVNRWGRFDPDSATVEIHASREPGDQDLLDLAAVQSLVRGAQVFAVSPPAVPGGGELAAVFRF